MENTNILVPVNGNADIYSKNIAECLKGTYQFSQTIYRNVCTGEQYEVQAGLWDYCAAFILVAVGIGLVIKLYQWIFR